MRLRFTDDPIRATEAAIAASRPTCWRFWLFDGATLRSPFATLVDEYGREIIQWHTATNTDSIGTGYYYVSGTERFISAMRRSIDRQRQRARDRSDAAIVFGTVEPAAVIGPDPGSRSGLGAMRARTLVITELFIVEPGRHHDAATKLRQRYLVPVSHRGLWEGWE